jgi:hypothetical protein
MMNILIIDDDEDVLIRLEPRWKQKVAERPRHGADEQQSPLRRNPNSTCCW